MIDKNKNNYVRKYLNIPNSYVFSSISDIIKEYISKTASINKIKIALAIILSKNIFNIKIPDKAAANGFVIYIG